MDFEVSPQKSQGIFSLSLSIFVLSPHNEAPRNHLQNYKPLVLAMDLIKSVTVRTEVHGFGAAAVAAELLKS